MTDHFSAVVMATELTEAWPDYPIVSATYSEARREMARKLGLLGVASFIMARPLRINNAVTSRIMLAGSPKNHDANGEGTDRADPGPHTVGCTSILLYQRLICQNVGCDTTIRQ